jgi:hypothetical protein
MLGVQCLTHVAVMLHVMQQFQNDWPVPNMYFMTRPIGNYSFDTGFTRLYKCDTKMLLYEVLYILIVWIIVHVWVILFEFFLRLLLILIDTYTIQAFWMSTFLLVCYSCVRGKCQTTPEVQVRRMDGRSDVTGIPGQYRHARVPGWKGHARRIP